MVHARRKSRGCGNPLHISKLTLAEPVERPSELSAEARASRQEQVVVDGDLQPQ